MNYKSIPTKPRPPRVENGVQIIDDVDLLMDDNYYYFYKDELFTGRSETRYKNGMLRVISEYKEGIPHGVQRSWFRNGQMKKEIFFEKGCARGWNKEWYENGRLHLERFIGDRGYSLQGKEYDDQGQVIRAWDEEGQLIIGEPSQEKPGCADTMMKKVFKELAPYREK
ncbi:MAG: hypothetical protein LIP01_16010 [Tannerellaceae bacterium]|nr:hypothetical protein [Tannerellaceae bacterium]